MEGKALRAASREYGVPVATLEGRIDWLVPSSPPSNFSSGVKGRVSTSLEGESLGMRRGLGHIQCTHLGNGTEWSKRECILPSLIILKCGLISRHEVTGW